MLKRFSFVPRSILGFIFLAAGVNGYFVIFEFEPFIATSPESMVLFQFDYLLVMEKSLEVVCGLLLLMNRFVPLALAILSPIIANILFLHLFLDHSLLPLAILLVFAHCFLLFQYRQNFSSLLEKRPSL